MALSADVLVENRTQELASMCWMAWAMTIRFLAVNPESVT